MAVPTEVLMKPLVWRLPILLPLLRELQANILKGHGRPHTRLLFFRFPPARRLALRSAISALPITSAIEQLEATEKRRVAGVDGPPVLLCFLSRTGYQALGVAAGRTPSDPAFLAGMKARNGLDDLNGWEPEYLGPIDAMVLACGQNAPQLDAILAPHLAALVAAGAILVADQLGDALFRDGAGIEHFGYVDGRSQPLMLDDEVVRELNNQGEPFVWNPQFGPLSTALVKDPGGDGPDSYGSYLVFRKLEQDVAGFKHAESELADALHLMNADARELAGALVVGRFEDGTPVVASKRALGAPHVANNFVYTGDPDAARCPFHSHVRKTNPRGDTVALGASLEEERQHLMPRRGITYGQRKPDLSDLPSSGVGLLFMAYNQDIERQFEFTQMKWADAANFARTGTGRDPVIGNGTAGHKWPKAWDDPNAGVTPFDFGEYVTAKGGEYFFAPTLGFLTGLAGRAD